MEQKRIFVMETDEFSEKNSVEFTEHENIMDQIHLQNYNF